MTDIEQALAEALHEWRKTQSLGGCGWKFRSGYCPCPADAAAILATEPMQAIAKQAAEDRILLGEAHGWLRLTRSVLSGWVDSADMVPAAVLRRELADPEPDHD